MGHQDHGVVIWDIDGTLIPADRRWLHRAIARTYELDQSDVRFPDGRVCGYTHESIVVDTAINSGIAVVDAEQGFARFERHLLEVMDEGRLEIARDQAAYPGAVDSIAALANAGFVQTVLTGNLRAAAEFKLGALGLDHRLNLDIGGYGSDARDRRQLADIVARRFAATYGHPLRPSRTLIIGDTPNDVACARHAGFAIAIVNHQAASRDHASQRRPDAVLDCLDPSRVVAVANELTTVDGSPRSRSWDGG